MERKNPITINESFTCKKCGNDVPKADTTCRNHCNRCLWSLHVDENVPGDRQSDCHGLMEPVGVVSSGKKGEQLIHECTRCGAKKQNKVLADDDRDEIIRISQRQNLEPLDHE